jgi:hypothetical protein
MPIVTAEYRRDEWPRRSDYEQDALEVLQTGAGWQEGAGWQ